MRSFVEITKNWIKMGWNVDEYGQECFKVGQILTENVKKLYKIACKEQFQPPEKPEPRTFVISIILHYYAKSSY